MRNLLSILTMVVLLVGCSAASGGLPTPNSDGQIVITATPPLPTPNADGIVIITATPRGAEVDTSAVSIPPAVNVADQSANVAPTAVAPATVAPTAVPIVDASRQLQEADRLRANGYFEESVAVYEAILNAGSSVDPAIRYEAAFNKGHAALRDGLFAEAVAALTILIDENVNASDVRTAQAYFLRGDAYLGTANWSAAIQDFERYLSLRPGLIDSYVWERIADAQLAIGQQSAALESYNRALAADRLLVPELILREKLGRILLAAGQVDSSVAQYDAILSVAQNDPYRASIEMDAASALMTVGRTDEAITRARRVFNEYFETAAAYEALQMLIAAGADGDIDGYRRGTVLYNQGAYPAAVDAFNEYTSSFQLSAIPANLYLLLGRAYRELGNPQAAVVAFTTIIEQYPTSPLLGDALLERGRTYFLSNQIAQAIDTYLAVAQNYPALAQAAPEAMWRAGYLYGTRQNDFVSSRETFTRLADLYPTSEWAVDGLEIAASVAVNNGEIAIAENLYGRLAAITSGDNQAAAYYWVGRLAQQRGDATAASEAFRQAQASASDSFHAVRAQDLLTGQAEPFVPPASIRTTFDEESDRRAAQEWLATTFGVDASGDLSQLSPELADDARMVRGRELWTVGAYDEAEAEFDALLDEARDNRDVVRSFQMAHFYQDLGAHLESQVAAANIITAAGVTTLQAPPYLARMRYPIPYFDLVEAQAAQYAFEPLLMISLMRQESLFDRNALSIANARGLTQVIPSTAIYIADQLNWDGFENSDLNRPYVSVAFGAYYLDEQLRIFNGNKAAALAAYNAGPGYTLDWVRLSGGDIDSLVSTITFDETRRYLQRIYSHYNIYRVLYGA